MSLHARSRQASRLVERKRWRRNVPAAGASRRNDNVRCAMIKNIVVNLNVRAKANWASDYAISVASELDAHLTGIVLLYSPIMPVSRAGYVPPELEVVEGHNEAAVEAARK